MNGGGIIWGAIICIPFWLFIIWLIKVGVITVETLFFVGLTLSGLLLFLILSSSSKEKKDSQDWDTFLKNIPTLPPHQSKSHPNDSSESGTPA